VSQYIDRKTVLNIVYTQQATRMADAYETLLADFSQMTAWGRGLESDLSHARVEISFLKAEVERLTVEADLKTPARKIQALEAEVERLRKAGDVTSKRLHWFCQKWGWKDDDLKTLTPEWNAAKEGKQP